VRERGERKRGEKEGRERGERRTFVSFNNIIIHRVYPFSSGLNRMASSGIKSCCTVGLMGDRGRSARKTNAGGLSRKERPKEERKEVKVVGLPKFGSGEGVGLADVLRSLLALATSTRPVDRVSPDTPDVLLIMCIVLIIILVGCCRWLLCACDTAASHEEVSLIDTVYYVFMKICFIFPILCICHIAVFLSVLAKQAK
jgi:hypothetical protein